MGKSGSGKSEAARFLAESHGLRLVKTGSICRQIAILLFGNDNKGSTQVLDDALTQIDPSIFLRAALRGIDQGENFIIDALRFREDVAIARDMGCMVLRVVAQPDLCLARLAGRGQAFDPETDGHHRSEVELDDAQVDLEICNDGEMSAFLTRLTSIPV